MVRLHRSRRNAKRDNCASLPRDHRADRAARYKGKNCGAWLYGCRHDAGRIGYPVRHEKNQGGKDQPQARNQASGQAMKVLSLCNQVPTVGIMAAAEPSTVEKFKAGMRDCGFIEGQTVRYEVRVAHGASEKLFSFAVELVRASVDLIAVVGAVTARAARAATRDVPIVYAVVVDPIGDGLATRSGQALGNMTGLTTYDPDQARMNTALLRSVKPDLKRIAFLADSAVSDCLVQANTRAAQEAGLHPQVFHITGPDPD